MYILNRDAAARLTISSPLEAHKAHTLVYDIVGVDVGFDNPMFACLELDYEVGSFWSSLPLMTLLSTGRRLTMTQLGRRLRLLSRWSLPFLFFFFTSSALSLSLSLIFSSDADIL